MREGVRGLSAEGVGREREGEEGGVCIIVGREGGWKECRLEIHSGKGGGGGGVVLDREGSPKGNEKRERKRRQTPDALNVSHNTERKKEKKREIERRVKATA